ncbi:MAG: ABC transporter permease [Curvibacter sp. RIFCSPHIGHO2_12_FULL_63_18]|uniref:ABC transporter permease n=1 Tax=Rhodoferax sp. TaxID=50421 RepID=UPI0008C4FAC7|nr:ABC transporter permease [Rhodoferax sp.]OGO96003.1 MAG: ABC transporter permease [Curvibacter sp. GWA2_63_95]OGP04693.1 MAG: ABC transporter permease [Curvibacter sp. RIFCSPHIGHO2_12_FULL_63_18]HCX81768.1 ABC transporter permease [Rhodoferax sp.]
MQHAHPTHSHPVALALLLAVLLPLGWSLWGAVAAGLDAAGWAALAHAPHTLAALGASVWTGVASTLLATAATAWILAATVGRLHSTAQGNRLTRLLSPLLAVPHAAFAIGLLALLAPSGWLLRLLSPWATGLTTPPPWPTTQDPWGLGLMAVLVCKEIPFLLWAALAHLQRPDVARRLQQELRLAHTLGYGASAAWWRVGWPQLLPRLAAPLLAVLAYGLTVVDVALLIGPSTPPTLAVLAWQWLQDADPVRNAQGAAAAWLLAAVLALCATLAWGLLHTPWRRQRWTRGAAEHTGRTPTAGGPTALAWLAVVYGAVMLALLLGSVIGPWPFPQLLPEAFTWVAWQGVARSSSTLWTTVWLALASSGAALLWAVAWLEWAPAHWQLRARPLLMLPLVLPAVLWVVGLHRLSLAWGLDTTGVGLWLAHTLAALPYVLIALQGPYQGFDPRLRHVSASLGHGHAVFLLRVKWPLLRSALAASAAIGFAVSVAQYLPTLYVGAGRFATVTTEAVNLAAGGQRSLTAAFAWLQWLLPVLVFALAVRLGRARRF